MRFPPIITRLSHHPITRPVYTRPPQPGSVLEVPRDTCDSEKGTTIQIPDNGWVRVAAYLFSELPEYCY